MNDGTEPSDARSAVYLRMLLAAFGAVVGLALCVWATVVAARDGGGQYVVTAIVAGAVAVVAVVNLVVVGRRRR